MLGRLKLVIADTDEAYVENMVNFLINNYSNIFEISSFTIAHCFNNFLQKADEEIDMLLISPEMYTASLPSGKAKTIVMLCEGSLSGKYSELEVIDKYQQGNRIAGHLINLLSRDVSEGSYFAGAAKRTGTIAVYSPAGGVGKTCLAVSLSACCARKGLSVFYLNLESAATTPLYFESSSTRNFSNIIYSLKEGHKNIPLKVEGVRLVDAGYNIHYFSPPDSMEEISELSPQELRRLIWTLKETGRYDMVFVDMESSFNSRSTALFDECDEIFVIAVPSDVCLSKLKTFSRELDILSQKGYEKIEQKITLILNKCRNDSNQVYEDMKIAGKAAVVKIPEYSELNGLINAGNSTKSMDVLFPVIGDFLDGLISPCSEEFFSALL